MTLDQWLTQTGTSETEFARRVRSSQPTINRLRKGLARADRSLARAIHHATGGAVAPNEIPTRERSRLVAWTPEMLGRLSDGVDRDEPPSRIAEAVGVAREALAAGLIRLLRAERAAARGRRR